MIKPEGFFGGMLAEPVARSGVVGRAAEFHASARGASSRRGNCLGAGLLGLGRATK